MKWSYLLLATARVEKSKTRKNFLKQALILTPQAVNRIKQLLAEKPEAVALKISVKERGCNGYTYTLDYANANTKNKFDEEVYQDGVKIWLDSKAQLSLLGSEMDYIKTRLSSEFVFRNPNITGTCGCGESFSL